MQAMVRRLKQAKQTYLSGLVMKSIDFLKSPSLLISVSSGGPTPKKTLSSTCGQVYEERKFKVVSHLS